MTVSYNLDVSRNNFISSFRVLKRWKGSIWKLVLPDLIAWLIAYYSVLFLYRSEWVLNPDQQRIFEMFAYHISRRIDYIPLTFLLGFFVTLVVNRWTKIFDNMGWIENAAVTISCVIRGTEDNVVLARRTLIRYLCLSQVLVFRDISVKVRRRFPTLESLESAGYFEPEELKMFEEIDIGNFNKYWVPINWAAAIVFRLRESNNEFKAFRSNLMTLCNFDWVPVPLAYPQVVFFAVRIYFLLCLVGRQYIIGEEAQNKSIIDLYVPFMTILQFIFYVGWMKVAESLLNPMGEDDDHFECNSLIDKNIATGMAIVDDNYDKVPTMRMDRFKENKDPVYAENAVPKHPVGQFMGSAAHLIMIPPNEPVSMIPVKSEPMIETAIEDITSPMTSIKRRIRRLSQTSGAFSRSVRSASLAPDSRKESVVAKFAHSINGRLSSDAGFNNSFDSFNSPFGATQHEFPFNYDGHPVPLSPPHHHGLAPHHKPVLTEIIEEEQGGISREPSIVRDSDKESQKSPGGSSVLSELANVPGSRFYVQSPLSVPEEEVLDHIPSDTVIEATDITPKPSLTFTLESPASSPPSSPPPSPTPSRSIRAKGEKTEKPTDL